MASRYNEHPKRSGWQPIVGGGAIWIDVHHFRLMSFNRPLAPWRETYEEALADALEQRCASRDRRTGRTHLTVPAWIREVEASDITERLVRLRPKRQLIEVARDELERRAKRR